MLCSFLACQQKITVRLKEDIRIGAEAAWEGAKEVSAKQGHPDVLGKGELLPQSTNRETCRAVLVLRMKGNVEFSFHVVR